MGNLLLNKIVKMSSNLLLIMFVTSNLYSSDINFEITSEKPKEILNYVNQVLKINRSISYQDYKEAKDIFDWGSQIINNGKDIYKVFPTSNNTIAIVFLEIPSLREQSLLIQKISDNSFIVRYRFFKVDFITFDVSFVDSKVIGNITINRRFMNDVKLKFETMVDEINNSVNKSEIEKQSKKFNQELEEKLAEAKSKQGELNEGIDEMATKLYFYLQNAIESYNQKR